MKYHYKIRMKGGSKVLLDSQIKKDILPFNNKLEAENAAKSAINLIAVINKTAANKLEYNVYSVNPTLKNNRANDEIGDG